MPFKQVSTRLTMATDSTMDFTTTSNNWGSECERTCLARAQTTEHTDTNLNADG